MTNEDILQYETGTFNVKSRTLSDNEIVPVEEKFKVGFLYFGSLPAQNSIDIYAFLLDKNNKLLSDDYVVNHNSRLRLKVKNRGADDTVISPIIELQSTDEIDCCATRPTDPEMAVIGVMIYATGAIPFEMHPDAITWDFDLSRLSPEVDKVIIVANKYRKFESEWIGFLTRFYYPYQDTLDAEFLYYVPSEKYEDCSTVEICGIYKENNNWKIKTIGKEYSYINLLFENYGLS